MSLSNVSIEIHRSKKRKRTIAILVKAERVVVRVPHRTPDGAIYDLLTQRRAWIEKHLAVQRNQPPLPPPKTEWAAGESIAYLGEPHFLETHFDLPALHAWYLEKARAVLVERTAHFAQLMGVQPKKVIVKHQKKRWGSCSVDNVIRYNWKIIKAPLHLLDYLVVHELAHIREKNHGPRFWDLVHRFVPDAKQRRVALHCLAKSLS